MNMNQVHTIAKTVRINEALTSLLQLRITAAVTQHTSPATHDHITYTSKIYWQMSTTTGFLICDKYFLNIILRSTRHGINMRYFSADLHIVTNSASANENIAYRYIHGRPKTALLWILSKTYTTRKRVNNALQLQATRRRAVPIRFYMSPVPTVKLLSLFVTIL